MAGFLRVACLALLVATGCGAAIAQSAANHVDAGDLRLESLPQQVLESGHCSLFLWSRSERPVFILFAQDNPARATVRMQGKLRTLERASVSGKQTYGYFESQSFSGGGVAFKIDLAFDADSPVKDGAVIKTGILRTRMSDGSEAVLPVGGMVGCKAA